MLLELNITNFAIIEKLSTTFREGLNTLTGETGAGKSIIIDALGAVLGGRVGPEVIRTGCDSARIEALFDLSKLEGYAEGELRTLLDEGGIEMEDPFILNREIGRSGRSVCRINGRATPVGLLNRVGQLLVDIHGQSDHLSLLRPAEHVFFLDRYAGLSERRAEVAAKVRRLRDLRRELSELAQSEREVARRVDLLDFQVKEISAAKLKSGEEEELAVEHRLLSNAEQLSARSASAYALLYESGTGKSSALDCLGRAMKDVEELARLDPVMQEQADLIESVTYQLEELARSLRNYRDSVEFNPGRLSAIEERMELIHSLKRKYGGSVDEVLQFGERTQAELDSITHREERIEELRREEADLCREVGSLCLELSILRQQAAGSLARAIEGELQDLNMAGACFAVGIVQADEPGGVPYGSGGRDGEGSLPRFVAFDETGADRVEFLISPNPGERPKPLSRIASGGETSRIMLAMKTILSRADPVPTLIFDEIDVGVGGRSGHLVGQKLWNLAHSHQVMCITHSPQIASFGDAHFNVYKQLTGERTVTQLRELTVMERIVELAQMLGTDTEATRKSAEEMIAQAAQSKVIRS